MKKYLLTIVILFICNIMYSQYIENLGSTMSSIVSKLELENTRYEKFYHEQVDRNIITIESNDLVILYFSSHNRRYCEYVQIVPKSLKFGNYLKDIFDIGLNIIKPDTWEGKRKDGRMFNVEIDISYENYSFLIYFK